MDYLEEPDGKMRRYWVYGLFLDSELPFPELVEVPQEGRKPDVSLRFGDIDLGVDDWRPFGPYFCFTEEAFLTTISPKCRFTCRRGHEIIVEMHSSFSLMEIRTHILGGGLATIRQQRGELSLHVSAVDTPDGAWAFTGPSGSGKSTTAAMISKETGWPIITDDVAGITIKNDQTMILGGVTKFKLWKDSMALLDMRVSDGQQDMWRPEKYHFTGKGDFIFKSRRLVKMFELTGEGDPGTSIVNGFRKVDILGDAVFRNYTVGLFSSAITTRQQLLKAAQTVTILKFNRGNAKSAAELCDALLA